MYMFQSILDTVPKTRSQMVNDLEIPEDVTVAPYVWSEPDTVGSDSISSVSVEELEARSIISSDSSLALSRAMTDSEIDYGRYRRLKSRSLSDPWVQMRTALDAFPPGYLDSLNSFQGTSSESVEDCSTVLERRRYNEELRLKMERFFHEECCVFAPDDPGLLALEEALNADQNVDSDIDSSTP